MMAVEFYIHKMSEHMETAQILKWHAREGERVAKFQVIMEVMTDKVTAELEAPEAGIIRGIRAGAVDGATVPVGEPICFIAEEGERVPVLPPLSGAAGTPVEEEATTATMGQIAFSEKPDASDEMVAGPRASPVARKVAKALGVDLNKVAGTGPLGRITESDVRAAAQPPAPVAPPSAVALLASAHLPAPARATPLPLTPIQRITGERMRESVVNAPQFALDMMVDMTQALWLREQLAERIKAQTDAHLSVTTLLIKVVASALSHHPRANAEFAGDHLRVHEDINIAVAIGVEDGLVAPVIRNADRKPLGEIARELRRFQEQAKSLRFATEDLSGGTFTISNLGMFGVDHFQAIVNPPQCAILAVGRIRQTPVGLPDEERIALRPMMNLSLTVDHRCLDGLQAARLLAELKDLLERPHLLLA
jgi:pyruvate dehydrogenase E2 component (dihydrolipoamide acetyltransferase)